MLKTIKALEAMMQAKREPSTSTSAVNYEPSSPAPSEHQEPTSPTPSDHHEPTIPAPSEDEATSDWAEEITPDSGVSGEPSSPASDEPISDDDSASDGDTVPVNGVALPLSAAIVEARVVEVSCANNLMLIYYYVINMFSFLLYLAHRELGGEIKTAEPASNHRASSEADFRSA